MNQGKGHTGGQKTSWGKVASWYDELLEEGKDTFQKEVILPNILRLMNIKKGQKILDLGCGQGFFCRAFAAAGATVMGIDISPELIAIAKERSAKVKPQINYVVGSAEKLLNTPSESVDTITIILAIQNIERMNSVFAECQRVLKGGGRLCLVVNHPAFRIPQGSSWGWDEANMTQYRRVDRYLSEAKIKVDMHPGETKKDFTVSFHRPLQVYFKHLAKAGFGVVRLEEWISHRHGPKGRTYEALERARKEIPLFLAVEAKKV